MRHDDQHRPDVADGIELVFYIGGMLVTAISALHRPTSSELVIAVVGVPAWAGWPSPAQDYCDGTIDLSAHLIPRPAATFLVRAAGDCMAGAGIADGDELIVDRSLHPRDGQIVIAIIDDHIVVKTWRTNPARLQSHPHPNQQGFADLLVAEHDVQVWGVVTYVLHHAP